MDPMEERAELARGPIPAFALPLLGRVDRASRSLLYGLLSHWRRFRITKPVTRLLGPQYRRSRRLIEIDITYACNLHCLNCNRSSTQAPEALHITKARVTGFVEDSIARGVAWRRIRVLGGEPTVHPEFGEILAELLRYKRWNPRCRIEVVTNGYGTHAEKQLSLLPKEVCVRNTSKSSPIQSHFGPFNLAPIDDAAFRGADFRNACFVTETCGMGLTPMGYYPCAVAGGIDRILGGTMGRSTIPDETDDMTGELDRLCRLCGRFRDGHCVPKALRPPLLEAKMSPTWVELYARWRRRARTAEFANAESPRRPNVPSGVERVAVSSERRSS